MKFQRTVIILGLLFLAAMLAIGAGLIGARGEGVEGEPIRSSLSRWSRVQWPLRTLGCAVSGVRGSVLATGGASK